MSKLDVDGTVRELESGSTPKWIQDHLEVYRRSAGKEGHFWDSTIAGGKGMVPCLILTTIGRRSGEKRSSPLIYGTDGDAYVIIGSKGGAEKHTGWYYNLLANPDVELEVANERFAARARVATGAERERLWAKMLDVYPPYRDYQAKTSREIPVVVLEKLAR